MTGFGQGQIRTDGIFCRVEVRSINHRFFDVNIRLPKKFASLEGRFRQEIQNRFSRGKFDLNLSWQMAEGNYRELKIDLSLARQFIKALKELKEEFKLSGQISTDAIAYYKDIFVIEEKETELEEVWDISRQALAQALDTLGDMKIREGDFLKNDIQARTDQISHDLSQIKAFFPEVINGYRDKLQERINTVFGGVKLEPDRLTQEIVLMAERSDITEEIVRLESHIEQFCSILGGDSPVGRKLEFMLQEMNREVNTIGNKLNDFKISQLVVDIKSELEKIREQVQNIE
jgi:uncharacterized protein (TIGR00255 family)